MNPHSPGRWLTLALLLPLVGCAGPSADVDLLEARLRDQQDLVARYQKLADTSQQELASARKETDLLRTQLAQGGASPLLPEHADVLLRAEKLAFHPMMTGARNIDDAPGDDVLNVVISPQANNGETIRLIGDLEIEALDLSRPAGEQRIGAWTYTAEQARELWHAGFLASGFQMDLAWDARPQSSEVLLHARLNTADGRQLDASQQVHVDLPVVQTVMSGAPPQIAPRQVAAARPVPPAATDTHEPPPAPETFPEAETAPLTLAPADGNAPTTLPPATAVSVNDLPADAAPHHPAATATSPLTPNPFPLPVDVSPLDAAAVAVTEPLPDADLASTPFDILPTDVPAPVDVPSTPAPAIPEAVSIESGPPAEFPPAVREAPAETSPGSDSSTPAGLVHLPTIEPQTAALPHTASAAAATGRVELLPEATPTATDMTIQPLPVPQRYRRNTPASPTTGELSGSNTPSEAWKPITPPPASAAPSPFPIDITPPAGPASPAPLAAPVIQTSDVWTDDSIPYLR